MRNLIIIIPFLLIGLPFFAQDPSITIIPSSAIINDQQDTVIILFDLKSNRKIQFYNIFLKVTLDGEEIHPKGIFGDVGNLVKAGSKKIIWTTTIDVLELSGELKIEVLTDTPMDGSGGGAMNQQDIKIVPAYAGLGGTVVTSGTLAFLGLKANSDYKDNFRPLYDIYASSKNPNDASIYGGAKPTRDELYDEANKKYKKGQYFLAAGGAVLVAGGYMMISRIIKIKKYKRDMNNINSTSSNKPYFDFALNNKNEIPSIGIRLNF